MLRNRMVQSAVRTVQVSLVKKFGGDAQEITSYINQFEASLRNISDAEIAKFGGWDAVANMAIKAF